MADLGTIFGGILDTVVDYQTQRFTQQPVNDSPFIPNFVENAIETTQTVDAQGNVMSCGTGHPKRVLGYMDANGNFCKKKSRRRRNRLATKADIKDLSALKGVLGGGKAFETWIATHN
jgi:hypothetical protein